MTEKPIISIEVDDSKFKAFLKLFQDYSDKLEDMPESWRKIDEAMTSSGFVDQTAKVKDLLAISLAQTAGIAEAINLSAHAQDKLTLSAKKSNVEWSKLGSSVINATRGILSFGGIAAAIAGVGGGIGVLDLAGSVLQNQRQASGLGVSVGQMRAWQTNMSPFVGANVLQGAAGAQLDPSQYGYLAALGISGSQSQSESSTQLATQISNAARRAYQQNPNTNSAQAQAFFALGGTISDWRNLGTANGKFLSSSENSVNGDASALGYSSKTAQGWQQLSVQMSKAGYMFQTGLIDLLSSLTGPLTNFSKAVLGALEALARSPEVQKGIQDFADWISSPDLMSDLKSFGAAVKTIGQDVVAAVNWITGKVPDAPGLIPTGTTAANSQNMPGLPGIIARLPIALGGLGNPQSMSQPQQTTASAVMRQLETAGYSKNFAAAIAANFGAESSFMPGASSYDPKTGWHRGMGQWSKARRDAILRGTGGKIDVWSNDPQMQVNGAIWEFRNTQKSAYQKIVAQKTALGMGIATDKYYEVSGDNYLQQLGRGIVTRQFAMWGPDAPHTASGGNSPSITALLKRLAHQGIIKQKVSLSISNSTSARVGMSANAALA